MSKFLQIIVSNIPSEDKSSKLNMVSTLVKLIDTIKGIDVKVVDHNTFIINVKGHDITMDVRDIQSDVHEQARPSFDLTYNLDKEINNMAAKALYKGPGSGLTGEFGTSAMQANAAVKKREKAIKKAVPVYNDITKELEAAITAYRSKPARNTNI